jgi:hypothetical protein
MKVVVRTYSAAEYSVRYCGDDCVERFIADQCDCATLVERLPPYDTMPACNLTDTLDCVEPLRIGLLNMSDPRW